MTLSGLTGGIVVCGVFLFVCASNGFSLRALSMNDVISASGSVDSSKDFYRFGNQSTKSSDEEVAGSYVILTVRLGEGTSAETLRATEFKGKLINRQGPSTNYIYEITKNGKAYSVGFLPENSFAFRAFREPGSGQEKTGTTKYATISLNIPNAKLESVKRGDFGLKIYKVNHGVPVETMSAAVLETLLAEDKLSIKYELSETAMASQIKTAN
jgi:hypothetical protein